MRHRPNLAEEIAGIGDLPRDELVARWVRQYGVPPPKGFSRSLLELSAAHTLQVEASGSRTSASRKALTRLESNSTRQVRPTRFLAAGSRLIRVWNGRSHQVEVTEQGYLWNDKSYKSLSAIARAITGSHWSGPRFFRAVR